ncbi:terpenoid synthase [Nemania sp. NC0429]|nr:terpenoid synthase [Nemania sp. NC0429]
MSAVAVQRVPNDPRPANDPRIEIVKQLRASSYYIPSFEPLFKEWPNAINPHYPQLKVSLDARIHKLYSPEKAAELIRGDYGLFVCQWWPHVPLERLETCAGWVLWLFTWDDEIDQSTSDLYFSLSDSNNFRDESYHFIRYCLGVPTEETDKWEFEKNTPTRPIIHCVEELGEKLKQAYNRDQLMVFIDALGYYMSGQQEEQVLKLKGVVPTPEQYLQNRLGAGGVDFCLALNEYADGQCIPRWIMDHEQMKAVWHETSLNMCLFNDVMSLRKEIKHGEVDSMVPLLMYHRALTVQEAIADTWMEMQSNVHRLDKAADTLLQMVREREPERCKDVDKFVTGCLYPLTGHLKWSLTSRRYGLADLPRDEHGGIRVGPTVV